MKKKLACILSAVMTVFACVSLGLTANSFAENAPRLDTSAMDSPSKLWSEVSGFSVEENVDVPDYMKYGKVLNSPSVEEILVTAESEEDYLEDWEKNGVKLTSETANKSIEFKNLIDVSKMTLADDLIVFSPLMTSRGTFDYTKVSITLTDALDENNWVTISVEQSKTSTILSRVKVATPTISARGYRYGGAITGTVTSAGVADVVGICMDGYTREAVRSGGSYVKMLDKTECRHRPFRLHFDAENSLFAVTAQAGERFNILKLDDGHSVGYGNEWSGFKSNFVKLSVSLSGFNTSEANLLVLNVCNTPMNGTKLQDTVAPVLTVDCDKEEIPLAATGRSYPLMDYECHDVLSGEIECEIKITDPDGITKTQKELNFIPQKSGYYQVAYIATDAAGNQSTFEYEILSQKAIPAIAINLSESILNAKVGDMVTIPTATLSGGAGRLTQSVSVQRVGAVNEIDVQNGAFVPKFAGEYFIEYTATDYVGNTTRETAVVYVENATDALLEVEPQHLKRLYDGVRVDLPKLEVYDYSLKAGVKSRADYTITAYSADGTYSEKITDGTFTPDKEKFGDSVTIEYSYYRRGDASNKQTYSYTVALFDKEVNWQEYFIYEENDFNVKLNKTGEFGFINFSTKENALGTKSLAFANPIAVKGFGVSFSIPGNMKGFQSVSFILEDSEDPNIGFEMELKELQGGADATSKTYVVHNGVHYAMSGTFNTMVDGVDTASITPLQLKMVNGALYDYLNTKVFEPSANFDGTKFNGFPSGKAYFAIRFNGITDLSGISLTKLGSQNFFARYNTKTGELLPAQDKIEPEIFLDTNVPDSLKMGQEIEIPFARSYDVLTPSIDTVFTLVAPDGSRIFQGQKMEKGLTFVAQMYGKYQLSYTAVDGAGNDTTVYYSIKLMDTVSPTVAVSVESVTMKVNGKLRVPTFVCQDNTDASPQLFLYIIEPNETIVSLGTPENLIVYRPKQRGEYTLVYYAVDESFNVVVKTVAVIVQ